MKAALILMLGMGAMAAYGQTYSYSGAFNGWTEVDLAPDGGTGTGGSVVDFQAITETVNYSATAQTLQEEGSLTVSPATVTFDIYSGPFFLGPPESGSATITVDNNGAFLFDDTYSVGGGGFFSGDLAIPVSGSGVYDGQPFSASWNIEIPIIGEISAVSSASLTFSEQSFQGAQQAVGVVDDLADGTSDGTYYYSLNTGSLTAAADPATVPDTTNCLLLLGLALSFLPFFPRR